MAWVITQERPGAVRPLEGWTMKNFCGFCGREINAQNPGPRCTGCDREMVAQGRLETLATVLVERLEPVELKELHDLLLLDADSVAETIGEELRELAQG